MVNIKKHKWIISWSFFSILVVAFVTFACMFEDKTWIGNLLQTIGTIAGFCLTLIIFQYTKEDSDKQFGQQLEHLQKLNNAQIEALQTSTERQILALQELNSKQIETLHQTTEKQILNQQELTERQIASLIESTKSEIESFEKNILQVTNKLADNSVFLAEILVRELENSVVVHSNALITEGKKLKVAQEWTLGRTIDERTIQINEQTNRIQHINSWKNYLENKLQSVRNYLNNRQNDLNS